MDEETRTALQDLRDLLDARSDELRARVIALENELFPPSMANDPEPPPE